MTITNPLRTQLKKEYVQVNRGRGRHKSTMTGSFLFVFKSRSLKRSTVFVTVTQIKTIVAIF